MPIRLRALAFGLSAAVGAVCLTQVSAREQGGPGAVVASKRMPDGTLWTTENLNVNTARSYCYDDAEMNCRR
jgi:hypothetical protein